jgi:hypothetical protein
MPVRIITTQSETSLGFLRNFESTDENIEFKFASDEYHEKGILAPSFYIEGSMNITYSGMYIRGEKITYHVGSAQAGSEKIAATYLELDRRWDVL